ncbi:MAG: hypothetical protein J6B28_02400 [Eubacterium sp.]|nr:hypothetical protein [Eubacterium sp.]
MGRLDLYGRFFRPLLYRTILKVSEKSCEKCKQCKGKLVDTASYLYLIPVMFDQEHEESAAYYINHAVRIENEEQIPNGNRACRIDVLQCQDCGHRVVSVVDFLKVREDALIKGGDIYPYEEFKDFLFS